jgi:tetratricopeptide (TPR) repeat protein
MCIRRLAGCLLVVLLACGCVWRWSWLPTEPTRPSADVAELLLRADKALDRADTREGVVAAIEAYEEVLTADPENFKALTLAGNLYLLLGDAYTSSRRDKRHSFRRAIALNEGAMRTNSEFRRLVDGGEEVWEACRVLTDQELDAMGFWATGVFYLFKEGQGPAGQILNFRWMGRALGVLERMQEIDPEWGGGGVAFSLGIYYLGVPESVGGDRERSAQYFAQAIETAPSWIVNRWGRARYYHIKMENRAAFEDDMRWVLEQDPRTGGSLYPWNTYFQNDAREKLANLEDYFPASE